jgi:hypothetical protein
MVKTMGQYKGSGNVFVHLSSPVDDAKCILAEKQIVAPLTQEGYVAIEEGYICKANQVQWMVGVSRLMPSARGGMLL